METKIVVSLFFFVVVVAAMATLQVGAADVHKTADNYYDEILDRNVKNLQHLFEKTQTKIDTELAKKEEQAASSQKDLERYSNAGRLRRFLYNCYNCCCCAYCNLERCPFSDISEEPSIARTLENQDLQRQRQLQQDFERFRKSLSSSLAEGPAEPPAVIIEKFLLSYRELFSQDEKLFLSALFSPLGESQLLQQQQQRERIQHLEHRAYQLELELAKPELEPERKRKLEQELEQTRERVEKAQAQPQAQPQPQRLQALQALPQELEKLEETRLAQEIEKPGGKKWAVVGLSSLAVFSAAAAALIFWTLEKQKKAGRKNVSFANGHSLDGVRPH